MQEVNFFGHPLFHPLAVFEDRFKQVRQKIRSDLGAALGPDSALLLDYVMIAGRNSYEGIRAGLPVAAAIQQWEDLLSGTFDTWPVRQEKLKDRCGRIAAQIARALALNGIHPRGMLLDLGAGSGGVARMIKDSYGLDAACLTDVVDYRFPEVQADERMHWAILAPPYDSLPFEGPFDLAIVTNVLHHCTAPEAIFALLRGRIREGGSLVVIESCVTVTESDLGRYPGSELIPYQALFDEKGAVLADNKDYFRLSAEETVLYATFCDWFYNRVLVAADIPVPYNFTHPERWNALFTRNGFRVKATYLMGFDQPLALEFHTLHLLTPV